MLPTFWRVSLRVVVVVDLWLFSAHCWSACVGDDVALQVFWILGEFFIVILVVAIVLAFCLCCFTCCLGYVVGLLSCVLRLAEVSSEFAVLRCWLLLVRYILVGWCTWHAVSAISCRVSDLTADLTHQFWVISGFVSLGLLVVAILLRASIGFGVDSVWFIPEAFSAVNPLVTNYVQYLQLPSNFRLTSLFAFGFAVLLLVEVVCWFVCCLAG